jgi:hypothetical protein
MNVALDLHPGRLYLLVAPHPEVDRLCDTLIARLALAGSVRVLDGGNRFDAHQIARYIRQQSAKLEAILGQIAIARAFTCYQMVTLLAEQDVSKSPLLALHLLNNFHDENVAVSERMRLLYLCIADLKRLAATSPVMVSATPATTPDRAPFLDNLSAAVERMWWFEMPTGPIQPHLL